MTMVGGRPAVRGWWLDGGLPHTSPPLWIPAFAGMTKWGGRNDDGGGPACCPWLVVGWGIASPLAAPLDSGLRRNDEVGRRNDEGGGPACCPWLVVGWGVASPLTAPLDSGLRRNDGGGGPACCPWLVVGWGLASPLTAPLDSGLRRNDDGGGAGMTMVGAGLLSVVGGWMGGCLTPHRPSGFRPSPE